MLLLLLTTLLLLLLSTISQTLSQPLQSFTGKLHTPSSLSPPPSTVITLNSGEHTALSSSLTGIFTFPNLTPGVYLLDVSDVIYAYPQVKIKIEENEAPKCNLYLYLGADRKTVPCSTLLSLPAIATYTYFEVKPPFSMRGLLMNPMFLMMGVGALGMFLLPKMMESMDPEQKEQMEKQMAMQSDPSAMFKELWSGGDEAASQGAGEGSSGVKKRRGKRE